MYVSCSCLACAMDRFPEVEDALSTIRDLGFRAFDLDVFENWQHINPSELARDPEAWATRLSKAMAANGLAVSSFNCGLSQRLADPDPAAFEQYCTEFAALLTLADGLACPNITLQPGPVLDGIGRAAQLQTMGDHLARLADLRGDRPLTIGLEGHAHTLIERPEEAIPLIDRVWPAVGYTYDPSHPELQGIPLPDAEPLFDRICHVHVRNASLGKMQDTMADGTVDFAWIVAALEAHGYDGALAIEYFGDFDPDFTSVAALRDHLVGLGVDPQP